MTLSEKFENDYNNRFARKIIVDDAYISRLSIGDQLNSCSYKQINDWTQNWISENGQIKLQKDNK